MTNFSEAASAGKTYVTRTPTACSFTSAHLLVHTFKRHQGTQSRSPLNRSLPSLRYHYLEVHRGKTFKGAQQCKNWREFDASSSSKKHAPSFKRGTVHVATGRVPRNPRLVKAKWLLKVTMSNFRLLFQVQILSEMIILIVTSRKS